MASEFSEDFPLGILDALFDRALEERYLVYALKSLRNPWFMPAPFADH